MDQKAMVLGWHIGRKMARLRQEKPRYWETIYDKQVTTLSLTDTYMGKNRNFGRREISDSDLQDEYVIYDPSIRVPIANCMVRITVCDDTLIVKIGTSIIQDFGNLECTYSNYKPGSGLDFCCRFYVNNGEWRHFILDTADPGTYNVKIERLVTE